MDSQVEEDENTTDINETVADEKGEIIDNVIKEMEDFGDIE